MRPKSEIYTSKRDDEHPCPFRMGVISPGPCGYHLTVIHVRLSDSKKRLGGPWLWISVDEISAGSIPRDRGGGGRAQSPKNFFSALWASVWFENKGGPLPGPSPRSATGDSWFAVTSFSGRGRCHSYLGVPVCRVSPLDPLGEGMPKTLIPPLTTILVTTKLFER